MGGEDPVRQSRRELGVRVTMREMGKEGLPGSNPLSNQHGLRDREMCWMWLVEQRVEDENLDSLQRVNGRLGHRLGVGQIGDGPNPIAVHASSAVIQLHRKDLDAPDISRVVRIDPVWSQLRLAGTRLRFHTGIEDVLEPTGELVNGFGGAVDGHLSTANGKCTEIVDATHMIRVIVCVENGIHGLDARGEELQAEFLWRIDEQPRSTIDLDYGSRPRTVIPRVFGGAYPAVTAYDRDAE